MVIVLLMLVQSRQLHGMNRVRRVVDLHLSRQLTWNRWRRKGRPQPCRADIVHPIQSRQMETFVIFARGI